jgi:16S rRNA processing protein RimM
MPRLRKRAAALNRVRDAAPPAWPPGDRAIVLAAVAGAHGVRGEVRLKRFTDAPEGLTRHAWLWAGERSLRLLGLRPGPHGDVARFAGIDTREAAEALRGRELAVPRSALPPPDEGEVYAVDLIGLPALADGAEVGRVVGVENFGAGDLVEVETPDGVRRLIPFARCEPGDAALAIDPAFLA